jgi:hypothetical protein
MWYFDTLRLAVVSVAPLSEDMLAYSSMPLPSAVQRPSGDPIKRLFA